MVVEVVVDVLWGSVLLEAEVGVVEGVGEVASVEWLDSVLVVGTIPVGSDSFTFGKINFMSLAFNKILSGLDAMPIILILKRFAYLNIFVNSAVFPE